jgi:NAD dependent epimerase/dehydratase family enzyme
MAQELLLRGQRVLPLALQQEAFLFHYPNLEQALQSLRARGSD